MHLRDERKPTVLTVDFQMTKGEGRDEWVPRSASATYKDRFVWVVGDQDALRHAASKLVRSDRMVQRYAPRQSSLRDDQQRLLIEERNRADGAQLELTEAVKAVFMAGQIYFRGLPVEPRSVGTTFVTALAAYGSTVGDALYPHPAAYTVSDKDILYLIENADLSAPPPVFGQEKLGLLSLDAGRYEVTCRGHVPQEILAYVKDNGGVTGASLLAKFGGSPHGVPPDVARAAVLGLLRCSKLRVEIQGVGEITSVRDEGARELTKDGGLRKARLTENTVETLTPRDKNAICTFFKEQLGKEVARDHDAIADAVAERFPLVRERLTTLGERFRRLPKSTAYPEALTKLERALESCRKDRRVEPTVMSVKRALPILRDGLTLLRRMETDLRDDAVAAIGDAERVTIYEWPGLLAVGPSDEARAAEAVIEAHLKTERPWEDSAQLAPHVARVRVEYRERRGAILDLHAKALEIAIERIKRRDGFDLLDPDQRHQVLRHVREGGASNTDAKAIVPSLEALDAQLASRRDTAERKALQELDALRETLGAAAVVEVDVQLAGREIDDEAGLDRALDAVRRRVMIEIVAGHRVRIKSS